MKRYPLNQSNLYKVTSPANLAERFQLELAELEDLANRRDNYKRFEVGKKKRRAVQEPKDRLKSIHLKVSRWLSRIETPDYLHSAVRGRSYITNAKAHCADTDLIKVDIRSFFQNVSIHAVFLFFANTMNCRKDAAMLIAKLLTVDGHLPTGSSVSPILSYFAHKRMFDEIAELAEKLDLQFTVYVDDMCLSGGNAVRATLFRVRGIIAKHGLRSHKCRYFPARVPRVVTGNALTIHGIRLPHRRHLKIKEAFDAFEQIQDENLRDEAFRSLRSRLHEAGQIEPIWGERARSFLVKRRSALAKR
ncbi:MAG: reverse transcriptase family protein [Pseudomonadota bacterium]